MSHSIFVSDLHLTPDRPRASELFFDFIGCAAPQAEALYILGDLFEYWVGDDDLGDAFNASIAGALRALSGKGTALYFLHGNRDVLIGQAFAARCEAKLIADPTIVDLYGTQSLVMHGDSLCTDDVEYQKFRVYSHDPANQRRFLALPLDARREQMLGMRAESEKSKQEKSAEIMDVAPAAAEQAFRESGCTRLIHGHTHRPARHIHVVDGRACERWVLTDWYGRAGYLRCDAAGCTLVAL
ncbi:MAG: UDP-2,3-diacylglucosamine diphosphatase [Betaproteobacteria bacterium]|nr:UDP-2,3-diacylglucosamine diphosphatase [Betaproteobacteria bacterium]